MKRTNEIRSFDCIRNRIKRDDIEALTSLYAKNLRKFFSEIYT